MTRLLGAGAFAWVYEAVDLDLEIPVALKVLRPEYAGDAAAEVRFRREATTAARLRHPNIVTIRDVGEAEGTVFVAMDLLPLSLARRLEVLPRLPEAEVVRFAIEVAAALSIAHADGVVHRDIKPDNVMLGSNGEAIVADFGLAGAFAGEAAKDEMAMAESGKVMGTPHYFSPEQARGLDLDGRTDLYSLGIMCYRAATGCLPFEGDDWYTVARQHVEDKPVPPKMLVPELTDGFESIVMRLLAKDPEHRFASATQLADALLTLPTAPASRSMSLVPNGASVTQVAFPYVHTAVVPVASRWRRNTLAAAIAVAALATFAIIAMPSVGGLRNPFITEGGVQPTTVPLVDSVRPPPTDSAKLPKDSIKLTAPVLPKGPPRAIAVARPPAAIPARVLVMLSAPDSAVLSVNDVAMAHGSWQGELATGQKHHFRARLDGALPGCKAAQLDTTIAFTSGQTATIELEVAQCSVLLLTVHPSESDYTLIGRDFSFKKEGRYPGTALPIVLRRGLYHLQVHSDRCADYTDTLTIHRDITTGSDTVKRNVGMIC